MPIANLQKLIPQSDFKTQAVIKHILFYKLFNKGNAKAINQGITYLFDAATNHFYPLSLSKLSQLYYYGLDSLAQKVDISQLLISKKKSTPCLCLCGNLLIDFKNNF